MAPNPPPPVPLTELYAVEANLLVVAEDALDPPPSTAVVVPGTAIAWDVDGTGLLWVRTVAITPNSVADCCTDYLVVTLGLGVLRCVEVMDDRGCPMPPNTLSGYANQLLADMTALRRVLSRVFCGKSHEPSLRAMNWSPLGPEGGVVGGEWTFDLRSQQDLP